MSSFSRHQQIFVCARRCCATVPFVVKPAARQNSTASGFCSWTISFAQRPPSARIHVSTAVHTVVPSPRARSSGERSRSPTYQSPSSGYPSRRSTIAISVEPRSNPITCLRVSGTLGGRDSSRCRAVSSVGDSPATSVKNAVHCRQNVATAAAWDVSSLLATTPTCSRLGKGGRVANGMDMRFEQRLADADVCCALAPRLSCRAINKRIARSALHQWPPSAPTHVSMRPLGCSSNFLMPDQRRWQLMRGVLDVNHAAMTWCERRR